MNVHSVVKNNMQEHTEEPKTGHRPLLILACVTIRHNSSTPADTASTEMGDRVRVQYPVPDIYFGM